MLSLWPRAVVAQSPLAEPPPSQPYVWRNVAMGGGGFVDGIVFHPSAKNLMYARTDVGGAYRWDDKRKEWIALTDWLSPAQGNFTGIESIALDPSDSNRVYLAAGTYSWGDAAILRSDDQGRNFQRTDVPFKMGGNEAGRFNGERLAVDPNDGEILFFGSRHDGLWKSNDRGATWRKVGGFPSIQPDQPPPVSNTATNALLRFRRGFGQQQAVGIVSVVFDPASGKPGSATPKIFAAVSTTGNQFLFQRGRRRDLAGGSEPANWTSSESPCSVAGRMFYLTYGRNPARIP